MSDTKPPFAGQARALIDHPAAKALGWGISKVGWLVMIWGVWSAKTFMAEYVTNHPAVQANRQAIITAAAKVSDIEQHNATQDAQLAQFQVNQIAIGDTLKKVSDTLAGMDKAQAVVTVRVDSLERRLNSREKPAN